MAWQLIEFGLFDIAHVRYSKVIIMTVCIGKWLESKVEGDFAGAAEVGRHHFRGVCSAARQKGSRRRALCLSHQVRFPSLNPPSAVTILANTLVKKL